MFVVHCFRNLAHVLHVRVSHLLAASLLASLA